MHGPEHITTAQERGWQWFSERAHGKHAVFWLVVLAFLEPIFSPLVPETLLVAMLLAGSDERKWKRYSAITTASSFAGGVAGYGVGMLAFHLFGIALLSYLGLSDIHGTIATILAGNIFLVMVFITFTPIPDKAFTLLSGFVGAPFLPYAAGFLVGRAARFTLVAYLVHRFGAKVLEAINKYSSWAAVAVVAILTAYAIVHWRLLF
jgi:membrane protein YqaA with SNARE-associated domain